MAVATKRKATGARRLKRPGVHGRSCDGSTEGHDCAPSNSTFMTNHRVRDLQGLLRALREEGCQVREKTEESEFGRPGWGIGPDGHKVRCRQPPEGQ